MPYICPKEHKPIRPSDFSIKCGHCEFAIMVRLAKESDPDYSCRYYDIKAKRDNIAGEIAFEVVE